MLSVTAGLSFNLNRRGFKRASQAQPVDYTPYLDRIRRLENTNNELASQNSELSKENEKLRNMPPKVVAEQKVSASPVALFFKIGKATLDKQRTDQPRILRKERHEGRQGQDLHADRLGRQGYRHARRSTSG